MADTHLIEVRAGRGEPPSLELRPGVELAPLSVGTGGAWQVSAHGVRLVHLYVYFDGQTLFLQSAEPEDPPLIDGEPVPGAWTPVSSRCSITFGEACLVFRPAHTEDVAEEEATVASAIQDFMPPAPLPPPAAPPPRLGANIPARPFKPGAFAAPLDDGESTRLQPLEDFAGPLSGDQTRAEPLMNPPPAMAAVRPAAGAPWARASTVPTTESPGHFEEPPPASLLNVPPPSIRKAPPPESFEAKVKREWAAAPPLRKGLFAAMPLAVILALWLVFGGGPPPPPPKDLTATPAKTATAAATTQSPLPPPIPTPWPPTEPGVPTTPSTPRPPTPGTATPPQNVGNAPTPAVPEGVAAGSTDRRERQAADFVATHAYDQAIRIYEQLAAEAASGQRPPNPAYREAAKILRGKLELGTP